MCGSRADGESSCVGCVTYTPHPAVGRVPYRMLPLMNDPSVYISVRVPGMWIGATVRVGVSCGSNRWCRWGGWGVSCGLAGHGRAAPYDRWWEGLR